MKAKLSSHSKVRGLTLPETLITLGVILILALILVPALSRPTGSPQKAKRISCVYNLKQIALAFRIFANEHNDLFPTQLSDEKGGAKQSIEHGDSYRVFLGISNELSAPKMALCPADDRLAAVDWQSLSNTKISYFIGLAAQDTRPDMLLSGDRNLAVDGKLLSGVVALGTNSAVTWTRAIHREKGNIGLADGSVQQVTTELLRQQLVKSGDATNLLVFPQ